mgnify:CR=1 FL=1
MEDDNTILPGSDFDRLFLFRDLNKDQRALLEPLFSPYQAEMGDLIFQQGGQASYLYLVVDGEVDICYKPEDGPPLIIAHVHPGGVVGWSAALGSPCYTSSALCATPCRLLRISGEDLRMLYEHHPQTGKLILERLSDLIAERLRNTHAHVFALLEQGLKLSVSANEPNIF